MQGHKMNAQADRQNHCYPLPQIETIGEGLKEKKTFQVNKANKAYLK